MPPFNTGVLTAGTHGLSAISGPVAKLHVLIRSTAWLWIFQIPLTLSERKSLNQRQERQLDDAEAGLILRGESFLQHVSVNLSI